MSLAAEIVWVDDSQLTAACHCRDADISLSGNEKKERGYDFVPISK